MAALTRTGAIGAQSSSGSNANVTHGLTINSGDLVIAIVHANNSSNGISDNNGGTPLAEVSEATASSFTRAIYWRIAGASEPANYSFTIATTTRWSMILLVYAPAGGETIAEAPFDVAPSSIASGTSTTPTASSIEVGVDNATTIAAAYIDNNSPLFNGWPGDSYTKAYDTGSLGVNSPTSASDKTRNTGTQSAVTWSIVTNPNWGAEQFSLKPSEAAGGEEHEKSLSDTINLSDGITKNFGVPKADTITLSDGIAKNIGLPEADTVNLSDGITKAPGLSRSDTISLSDNASLVVAFLRTLNDSINLSDGLAKNFGTTKADTITMSDNLVSIIVAILMSLNDTINISDGIAKNLGTTKADTINLSDNFSRVVAYLRTLADTITMSDSESLGIGLNKSDTVTLSDSVVKQTSLSKADIMTLSDSIAKEMGLSKADTITLSDFFSSDAGGALLFIIEQLGLNPMGGIH